MLADVSSIRSRKGADHNSPLQKGVPEPRLDEALFVTDASELPSSGGATYSEPELQQQPGEGTAGPVIDIPAPPGLSAEEMEADANRNLGLGEGCP